MHYKRTDVTNATYTTLNLHVVVETRRNTTEKGHKTLRIHFKRLL